MQVADYITAADAREFKNALRIVAAAFKRAAAAHKKAQSDQSAAALDAARAQYRAAARDALAARILAAPAYILAPDAADALAAAALARPGFNYRNYYSASSYSSDRRRAAAGLPRALDACERLREHYSCALIAYGGTLAAGRGEQFDSCALRYNAYGQLEAEYIAFQYYCTEYRDGIARAADYIRRCALRELTDDERVELDIAAREQREHTLDARADALTAAFEQSLA